MKIDIRTNTFVGNYSFYRKNLILIWNFMRNLSLANPNIPAAVRKFWTFTIYYIKLTVSSIYHRSS